MTYNNEYLNVYEQKEWKSKLFPISLDKAYDQSMDATHQSPVPSRKEAAVQLLAA